eukprot:EG_transcript_50714
MVSSDRGMVIDNVPENSRRGPRNSQKGQNFPSGSLTPKDLGNLDTFFAKRAKNGPLASFLSDLGPKIPHPSVLLAAHCTSGAPGGPQQACQAGRCRRLGMAADVAHHLRLRLTELLRG